MIDDVDLKILAILQADGRASHAELARQVGLVGSAVHERVKKLEERGIVRGYSARLDPEALGKKLLAFVFLRAEEDGTSNEVALALAKIPEVLEVHHVAGEDCYLAKVRTADTESLGRLIRERFRAIPQVHSTRSTIVLETIKEDLCLPLAGAS
ncbi:MAG: Lrp/AsnC family transcriptional regulator [Planctomycetota bacterium]